MKMIHRRTVVVLVIVLLTCGSGGPARGGGPTYSACILDTKKTADDLRAAARSALGADALWSTVFAPVLPARWPAAHGGVVLLIYRSEVLPTGIFRHRIRGPTAEVRSAAFGAPPQVRQLGARKVLGEELPRELPATGPSHLIDAEHILLDLVCGVRDPDTDTARAAMEPYRNWLRFHPLIAKDLQRRAPGFFTWLKASRPPR